MVDNKKTIHSILIIALLTPHVSVAATKKKTHLAKPPTREEIHQHINRNANRTGLDANLIKAVIHTESAWRYCIKSSAGARGLMQLMPATARRFGVSNRCDAGQNIRAGSTYLRWLYDRYGDWPKAIAGYNAGEGAVDKYNGIPPYDETQQYVRKVLNTYRQYRGKPPQKSAPAQAAAQATTVATAVTPFTDQQAFQAPTAIEWTPPADYYQFHPNGVTP